MLTASGMRSWYNFRTMVEQNEPQRLIIQRKRRAYSKEHTLGYYLVAGIGSLSVIFGFFYMGAHVVSALSQDYDGPLYLTPEQKQQQELITLQASDTDQDGLTDYDELYAYGTSRYLADSDGDGQGDLEEIQAGQDPNCPRGQDCANGLRNVYDPGLNPAAGLVEGSAALNGGGSDQTDALQEVIENTSATQIRQILLESGLDPELLDSMTDAQILALYEQTVLELEESGQLAEDALEANSIVE